MEQGKKRMYGIKAIKKMREAKLGKHISPKTEFKEGERPWNKGIKGLNLGGEKGWFRKGHQHSNRINKKRLKNLRKKILLKPKLKMNRDLAYAIGALKGDGSVGKNGNNYRICFDSTSKLLASNVFSSLKKVGLNPFTMERIPSNGIGKLKQYRVLASSKMFYIWYKRTGISKLRRLLDTREKAISFIRGFYEAEGSIHRQGKNTKVIQIYNTNLPLLKLVKFLLTKLGLKFNLHGPYQNNRLGGCNSKLIYRVCSGSKQNVNQFLKIIKPTVKILKPE